MDSWGMTMKKPVLPLCPTCGKVMNLVDLRRLAASRGSIPPPFEDPFTIECCDRQLIISDNEEWREVIRLLKEYHKVGE